MGSAVERPSVRLNVAAVGARAEAPLTTGELAAASSKRSPVLLVLGAVALLAVVAALGFALRPGATPEATLDAGMAAAALDAGLGPPVVAEVPEVDAGLAPPPVVAEAPEVDAGVEVPALLPLPEEPPPSLRFAGRLAGKAWLLSNQNGRDLTLCRMTLPGQRVAPLGAFPRVGTLEVPLKRFGVDGRAPALTRKARIDCVQGYGLIDIR